MGLSAALFLSSPLCLPQLFPELGDSLWSLQGERERAASVSLPRLCSLPAPFLDEMDTGINGHSLALVLPKTFSPAFYPRPSCFQALVSKGIKCLYYQWQ